jgi:methanogenic corrinoid protein MtbC1
LPEQTSQYIRKHQQEIAVQVVQRLDPPQDQGWSGNERELHQKSIRDVHYHLSYLAGALEHDDLLLFVDYLSWANTLFHSLNFPEEILHDTLRTMQDALQAELPPRLAAQALAFIEKGLENLETYPSSPSSFLQDHKPLYTLARQYLSALLNRNRAQASQMILHAVQEEEIPIKDIYLRVFQPVQKEIGRLWHLNQISVAQEHYCTAATQLIMSQLYPVLFRSEKHGHRLVAACVGKELHEIGIRMVADFFELDGWDTYYLGANTPSDTILEAIEDHQADLVALSATITPHIKEVKKLIAQIRAHYENTVKIMVGGYPFNTSPNLWRRVNADGYAGDAQEAISIASQWLRSGINRE